MSIKPYYEKYIATDEEKTEFDKTLAMLLAISYNLIKLTKLVIAEWGNGPNYARYAAGFSNKKAIEIAQKTKSFTMTAHILAAAAGSLSADDEMGKELALEALKDAKPKDLLEARLVLHAHALSTLGLVGSNQVARGTIPFSKSYSVATVFKTFNRTIGALVKYKDHRDKETSYVGDLIEIGERMNGSKRRY